MYYHGVINGLVDQKIVGMLTEGEIKSASKRNDGYNNGFNDMDYISVCEYLGEDVYESHPNNAFHTYVANHFCFIMSDDIEAQEPSLLSREETSDRFGLMRRRLQHPEERFSDLIDERQIRDTVPVDKVIAIGIPYNLEAKDGFVKLSSFSYLTMEEFANLVHFVEELASSLGIDVVDSSDPGFPRVLQNRRR